MSASIRLFAAAILIVFTGFVTRAPSTTLGAEERAGFTAVTDAMLLNPDPADWPNWRCTLDGWGYSPLDQINTQNVHQLQHARSWALQPGVSQPNPIVATGVMYVPVRVSTGNDGRAFDD